MAYKAPIWEDGKSPAISAENLNNLSQAAEGAQVLYGNSAPTSSTEGAVGQFYLVAVADSDGNYPLYQCVAITNGSYVWRDTRRIPDSITSMLGIPAPGTISSALNVLAHVGNLHVWERVQTYAEEVPAGYTLGDLQENVLVFTGNNENQSVLYYADSISVDKYGMVSLVSPSSYAFYTNSNFSPGYYAKGKFFYINPNAGSTAIDGIWFLPSDSNLNRNGAQYFAPTIQKVTGYAAIPAGTTTDYLTSTDRNAYPDNVTDAQDAYYTLGDVRGSFALTSLADTSWIWAYSDNVIISDDGETVELDNHSTVSLSRISASTAADILIGKFFKFNMSGLSDEPYDQKIYYIPSDATITHAIPSGEKYYRFDLDKYQPVTGHAAIPANTTITYLGQLGGGARIEVGSYVGTGTWGSSNKISLTFGFVPKIIFVQSYDDISYFHAINGVKESRGSASRNISFSWKDKTVSWYCSSGLDGQYNSSGEIYHYIAIG